MKNNLIMSSYRLDKNILSIAVKGSLLREFQELNLVLTDRETKNKGKYDLEVKETADGYILSIDLDQVEFYSHTKSILDVHLIIDHKRSVKLNQPVAKTKDRSIRYLENSYHITSKCVAVPYLTLEDSLAILYGDKKVIYDSYCTYIKDQATVSQVSVVNNKLTFAINHIDLEHADDIFFVVKNKKNHKVNTMVNHRLDKNNQVEIELEEIKDFFNRNKDAQFVLTMNVKYDRIVQTYQMGTNDAMQPLNKIVINEATSITPYIEGGELSLLYTDKWREGDHLYYEDLVTEKGRMSIILPEESSSMLNELSDWSLVLKNTTRSEWIVVGKEYYKADSKLIDIKLEDLYAAYQMNTSADWSFYIFAHRQQDDDVDVYNITKTTDWVESSANRYHQAFLAKDGINGIVFVTSKNNIGLTFGDKYKLPQLAYKKVNRLIPIHNLLCKEDGWIHFRLADIKAQNIKLARVLLKERGNVDVWQTEVEIGAEGSLALNLNEFVELYQYNVSRWDVLLEVTYNNVIVTGKVGTYNEPLLPKHQRYYNPIASKGNMMFVPYLSIYNELSLVVNNKNAISNEMVSASISLTEFSMRKSVVRGTTEVTIKDVEQFTVKHVMMKFRGKADEVIECLFPVLRTERKGNVLSINFELNLTEVELQPFYYDVYVIIEMDGKSYPVKIKNPTKKVKQAIDKKIVRYSYTFDNGYFIYPYISSVNTLAFTYREKPKYESLPYKIKENLAYCLYRLFKNYFDQKDIWLGYEKFSEGAQDNGYYFFKYCHENNKKENFYYIIKKDSVDYENVAPMKDKVVEFMSFKYMLYMYAAKLLISSESKGHAYDIRIQKGRLKRALTKKKHVFLQHGVTALKRVDYVFKKTKENAVNLFVATSDYEHDIIKKYFGYQDDEIITTGFCRWDVLEDQSGEEKEIFVMPTWRTWMDDLPEEQFLESDYYKNYAGFFQSKELGELLKQNNIKLSFYIHPKFKSYIDNFNVDNPNIKVYQYGEEKVNYLLMKSSMLVTDYSSVAWEMFYQKKPVVFFQFDLEKYNAFQGSYLDMNKELFGDQVFTVTQLVDQIKEYASRDFAEKEEFGVMRDKYFKYVDKNNCERTFNAIMNSKLMKKKKKKK